MSRNAQRSFQQRFHKYDNLSRRVATASYSSAAGISAGSDDPTTKATNRLALSETHFDEQGRVYQQLRRKVDATDGSLDGYLQALNWYDADGRLVKTDGQQLTKTFYDRLGRVTHEFVLAKDNDTAYAHAADVAGDVVREERQTTYDPDDGNVIMSALISRLHSDVGFGQTTGALDTNADTDPLKYTAANVKGRIQIAAFWHDELDRMVEEVRHGTYGGNTFDRSGLSVPARGPDPAHELRLRHRRRGPGRDRPQGAGAADRTGPGRPDGGRDPELRRRGPQRG